MHFSSRNKSIALGALASAAVIFGVQTVFPDATDMQQFGIWAIIAVVAYFSTLLYKSGK